MLETGMFRRSFVFMLTAAFTMLLGTLIDGIVIGSVLGAEAMAAYGLINPVVIAVSALGGMFADGGQTNFSKNLGSGKIPEASGIFSLTCVVSVAVAVVFGLSVFFGAVPIVNMLSGANSSAGMLDMGCRYLRGLSVIFNLGSLLGITAAALGRAMLMVAGVLYGEEDRDGIRKIIMLPDAFGKRICCWFWKAWSCLSFLLRYFRKQHLGLLAYGSLFRQQKL